MRKNDELDLIALIKQPDCVQHIGLQTDSLKSRIWNSKEPLSEVLAKAITSLGLTNGKFVAFPEEVCKP